MSAGRGRNGCTPAKNKTIRVGRADGSDVGQTGGSDTVTLQQANLPAVQVNVSGETSELPGQELTTRRRDGINTKAECFAFGEASGMIIT